jgi:glycine cleavage system aminomethyltransferase T
MLVPDPASHALRLATSWSRLNHVSCVRVSGPHAYEAVDRICPTDLFLRDTQMRSSLILREDGTVAADVYVCRDDQDFILIAEGLSAAELSDCVHSAAPHGLTFALEDLAADHDIVSVNGPYAWELLGEVLGPEIIGLPYLAFMHLQQGICFRAGKTGEYGYDILMARPAVGSLIEQLEERGQEFDTRAVDQGALDQCALENWFFNIRREGRAGASPLELQLQWRVSYRKSYLGSAALGVARQAGIQRRLTTLIADEPIEIDDDVLLDEAVIGRVVNAGFSHTRHDYVALALLQTRWSASGIDSYHVLRAQQQVPVRTVSPPVINNRSLHISPQLHSYRLRDQQLFPDLVPARGQAV